MRANWVIDHVLDGAFEFGFASQQVIEILSLPKGSVQPQQFLSSLRRERFPGVENLRKRIAWKETDHDVNMIRHDAPCEEAIPLLVEMAEGFADNFGDRRRL